MATCAPQTILISVPTAWAFLSRVLALSLMAANFVLTLFIQIHLHYTPLQAAWMLMASAVIIGLLSVLTGRLCDCIPTNVLVVCGLLGSTLVRGMALFPRSSISTVVPGTMGCAQTIRPSPKG